jgi:eukaryotic-like serine/threonine-protein kinase
VISATPRSLARRMLQRGWLTVFQINQLLVGHGQDLVFGPYHVLDRLGQGGQSTVYKARHAHFRWIVALKVIRSELLINADAKHQFLQEMEAMARLNHPNVVQFCDADQVGETYYCAMEYIEGTDLGKVVTLSGPQPVPQACDYIRQAALGLQHAHEHSLVHRDIKPMNLFLTMPSADTRLAPAPVIKILDWGLASLRPPGGALVGTSTENLAKGVIGTADYLSPEQAKNAHTVDIRGDLYSLGCTFYYLLTGRPPFAGGSLAQKLMRHHQEEPAALDALRADVQPTLAAVVQRLMAKRPEDRYQTPAAVALALMPFCRMTPASVEAARPAVRLHLRPDLRRNQENTPLPSALASDIDNAAPQATLTGTSGRAHTDTDATYL